MLFSEIIRAAPPRLDALTRIGVFAGALALCACAAHRPKPAPVQSAPAPVVVAPPAEAAGEPKKIAKPHAKPSTANTAAPAKKTPEPLQLADVGYYMDVMQGRLKQLSSAGVEVTRTGNGLVATLDVSFAANAGRLDVDAEHNPSLAAIAKVLNEYRQTHVAARVRDDAALGTAGEQALVRYLQNAGVAPEQLPTTPLPAARLEKPPSAGSAHVELDIQPVVRE